MTDKRPGISDAEYDEIQERVDRTVRAWTHRLGLRWWWIKVVIDTDAASFEHSSDERDSAAFRTTTNMEVVSDWQRMTATIRVNAYAVLEVDDAELEEWIVHELCHVLVSEMRTPAWSEPTAQEIMAQMDHEERVVTMLTKAFGWTYQAGAGELNEPDAVEEEDE